MKTRRLVIRVAAVLVLIIIGIIMSIIGRGHTIYLDNKTLEYNGQTYRSPSVVAKLITGSNWNGREFFHMPALNKTK